MFKKFNPNKNWIVYDNNPIMMKKNLDLIFPLSETDFDFISKMISYIDCSYDGSYKKFGIVPGIGIAANQLGYNKKIIYIHLNDEKNKEHKYLLANPKIVKKSFNKAYLENGEGCLSVKKKALGLSIRSEIVFVEAIDIFTQKKIKVKAEGILSACFQHEVDHTNNLFYYDSINKQAPFFVDESWKKI